MKFIEDQFLKLFKSTEKFLFWSLFKIDIKKSEILTIDRINGTCGVINFQQALEIFKNTFDLVCTRNIQWAVLPAFEPIVEKKWIWMKKRHCWQLSFKKFKLDGELWFRKFVVALDLSEISKQFWMDNFCRARLIVSSFKLFLPKDMTSDFVFIDGWAGRHLPLARENSNLLESQLEKIDLFLTDSNDIAQALKTWISDEKILEVRPCTNILDVKNIDVNLIQKSFLIF